VAIARSEISAERYKWSLRFTVINLANKTPFTTSCPHFSGTHYVTHESETAESASTFSSQEFRPGACKSRQYSCRAFFDLFANSTHYSLSATCPPECHRQMSSAPRRSAMFPIRLWAAHFRAGRIAAPRCAFCDPYAEKLGAQRGSEMARTLPQGLSHAWAWWRAPICLTRCCKRNRGRRRPDRELRRGPRCASLSHAARFLRCSGSKRLAGILAYKKDSARRR